MPPDDCYAPAAIMPRRCRGAGAVHPINGRLRDELLNETLFTSLAQARVAIALWRADYNTARPHSQIAWQTPAEFAGTFNPRRSLALRYAKGSAPAPVPSPAQQGTTHAGIELKTG
ncbi:transposase [Mesorhizobium sp. M7A.F.Ca.US.010.02.1.1]|uniref:integrase core domain-containing protein n=1 Tax=Mesorhizobium sp. M7A.F.Ca.US.010.02.1.1 TaxID=2496743 RepID=UPI002479A2F8|nr:transposase [Mesorhizobium sp. M7A.F.Ca.US.010.02.1.1]